MNLYTNNDDEGYMSQYVTDADTNEVLYRVYDLTEYPEDATISRELVSGHEFISYVKLGLELAKRGYSDVRLIEQ